MLFTSILNLLNLMNFGVIKHQDTISNDIHNFRNRFLRGVKYNESCNTEFAFFGLFADILRNFDSSR